METVTLTLTEFLLARIAEDEADNGCNGDGEYSTCWRRSERIERECEAKRRIVASCFEDHDYVERRGQADDPIELASEVLYALAAVYADHPDYRDEWRP